MSERDVARLLAGTVAVDDPRLGDLAGFLASLGEACPKASTVSCEAAHVSAMVEAAELRFEEFRPGVRPMREARGIMSLSRAPRPRTTRGRTVEPAGAGLARVVAVAAVLVLVFGGVAFGGALPPQLQNVVADVAAHIGIDVPRAGGAAPGDAVALGEVAGDDDGAREHPRSGGRRLRGATSDSGENRATDADDKVKRDKDAREQKADKRADGEHGHKADKRADGEHGHKVDKTDKDKHQVKVDGSGKGGRGDGEGNGAADGGGHRD